MGGIPDDGTKASVGRPDPAPSEQTGFTRRLLLGGAGAGLLATGYGLGLARDGQGDRSGAQASVPFHGRHQAGIATPPQEHLALAAFDLHADDAVSLRELLRDWSAVAARLTAGKPASRDALDGTPDPGEASDHGPASLTVTFGLGPTIFTQDGDDRLGLQHLAPAALRPLPYFRGDALQDRWSGGDLCVQACADSSQVAFHAVHVLARAARGAAGLRWLQTGFRGATSARERDPRNLMGFKDGTANVDTADAHAMGTSVWLDRGTSPSWMRDGTYMVVRRIRMLLDSWDALTIPAQERVIGRRKASGAPLGGRSKAERPDLDATHEDELVIPRDAHVRIAASHRAAAPPLLRRGYSFSDGVEPGTGHLDAGLIFISFQRDPGRQFVAIQQRLSDTDALADHVQHVGSATFACPPGGPTDGYIGQSLFAALGRART